MAFVDGRRQVMVVDEAGALRRQTGSGELAWATWEQGAHDGYSWPTWSPDGRRLAAFRIADDGNRVWVTDVDGVAGAEVAAMGDRVPVYLQWSPEGDALLALSQDAQELVLQRADPMGERPDREILRGSPLFVTWLPGDRLAAFVQDEPEGLPRLLVLGPGNRRRQLTGVPRDFCAPVPLPRGIAYVAQVRNQVALLVSSLDGSHVEELERVNGLVALGATPDATQLVRAISPDGSGTPYHDLALVDLATAAVAPITKRSCTAFFAIPNGGWLLAGREGVDRTVTWFHIDRHGAEERLFAISPSRDMGFYLRFFEQYAPSHPIVDPERDVCGGLRQPSGCERERTSRLRRAARRRSRRRDWAGTLWQLRPRTSNPSRQVST